MDRILKPCIVERGRKIKLDRSGIVIDDVIGTPYGSHFELRKGRLRKVEEEGLAAGMADPTLVETSSDNRDILDSAGESQKLTQEDIVGMKSSGMSGKDIVENVVEHSVTFQKKTEFSKKKYIDKKRKTHIQLVTALKSSTRLLCEMYYAKSANKILYMRSDIIARILTAINAHSNSRLIAVETAQGLLITSLLERLGGAGTLLHVFPGDRPVRVALEQSGHVPENFRTILMDFPLNRINQVLHDYRAENDTLLSQETNSSEEMQEPVDPIPISNLYENESGNTKASFSFQTSEVAEEEMENSCTESLSGSEEDEPKAKKKRTNRKEISFEERMRRRTIREEKFTKSRLELMKGNFDGLLVATRFHPEPIVLSLLPFLSPSRPLVVYCPFIEPLTNMYSKLKETGIVFDLHLSETWMRKYQVLPQRTHPLNQMVSGGGYILTGITVAKET